ncbi:hypothetical protein NE237_021404 [Protea cynaroides]|uniref:Uncharacterized protein n=1 Tax=Protea cynaroides TaxID=273540 RepID=A0A9Q0HD88_9MAGN|nr:hypothetical protein NE237_021404 [Protea cynaroides]
MKMMQLDRLIDNEDSPSAAPNDSSQTANPSSNSSYQHLTFSTKTYLLRSLFLLPQSHKYQQQHQRTHLPLLVFFKYLSITTFIEESSEIEAKGFPAGEKTTMAV